MEKIRNSMVLLVTWLLAVNWVERVHHPLNIASFVYVLTGVLAVAVVSMRRVRKARLAEISAASVAVFVALKWAFGYGLFRDNLPLTVTEGLIVVVTNFLAWRVGQGIDEFERDASDVVAMQLERAPLAFEAAESEMYEEVQRARRFERVLSLATVSMRATADATNIERLLREVRHELVRKYLESQLAKMLMGATSATDLVAYRNGAFVVLFPEIYGDKARELLQQVADDAEEQLGLRLRIGVAEFPEEECTLAGLIDRAEAELSDGGSGPRTKLESGPKPRVELVAEASSS